MQTTDVILTAGEIAKLGIPAKYFRIMDSVGPIDVTFWRNAREVATASNMLAGFYSQPAGGFDAISLLSATSQTVTIGTSDGTGGYDRGAADVTVLNTGGPLVVSMVDIAAAATDYQAAAANAARRYLLVQNQDAAVNLYLNFGAAATLGAGSVKIPPGGYWESAAYCSTDAIHLMATAATSNVAVVEG